jgi:NAD(P)-dependent dehydrogenase (short-subunit alcohol dehydrogenase family)
MLATPSSSPAPRCARLPRIDGKTVLVAGDVGPANEALARDLLEAGAQVVWPGVPAKIVARIADDPAARARLQTPDLDPCSSADVELLQDLCERELGGVDAVVVNIGEHETGSILPRASLEACDSIVSRRLRAHILLARAFPPALARRARTAYIFVNATHDCASPSAGSLSAAAAGAELALARSLAFETNGRPHVYVLMTSSSPDGLYGLDAEHLSEAVALIVADPEHARDQVIIQGAWREQLDPAVRSPDYQTGI